MSFNRTWYWMLAATAGAVVIFFEFDNPPDEPFSGMDRPVLLQVLVIAAALLAALYWLWFIYRYAKTTYEGVAKGKARSLVQLLVFLTVAWWFVAYVALSWGDYGVPPASVQSRCEPLEDSGRVETPAGDATALSPEGSIVVHFGPWRDERSSEVALLLPADVRAPTVEAGDFALTSLRGGDEVLSAETASIGVYQLRDRILVDVCVDLRDQAHTASGTYTGELIYVGDAANVPPVPVEVSVQARYLWALVPGIWVLAALTMWIAFDEWPKGQKRQFTSFIGVAGPVAGVLSVQGLRNPGWGGLTAVVGLIGAMYVAGQAAALVIKQGGYDLKEPEA